MTTLELKSSHEVIDTVNVADVESIFYCKPTDPDILTVLMKDGKRLYCDEVCPLQEEPVSNPIDFEQELYKAFGQVKDFTLGMRIAKWFYDMGKNSQEPVSEDLEEAAMMHYKDVMERKIITGLETANMTSFKAGAKWQKAQMMAKAIDAVELTVREGEHGDPYLIYVPDIEAMGLKAGDKVKVLIIKED